MTWQEKWLAVESDRDMRGDMREALETATAYVHQHTYLLELGLLMHMHSMYICCVQLLNMKNPSKSSKNRHLYWCCM